MLLTLKSGFCKARHLTRRGCKVRVAPAALAAAAEDKRLAVGHVLDDLVGLKVAHDRAARNADREVAAFFSILAGSLTVHAIFGDIPALIAKVHQR